MDPKEPNLQQLMQLANSPLGQQLLQRLKEQNGTALHSAAEMASSGNITQAKALLQTMLQDPEVKNILQQLGGGYGRNE